MANVSAAHPSTDRLAAFNQGRLDAVEQATVEQYVANCTVCCDLLRRLPDDTLLGRLRQANTASEAPAATLDGPVADAARDPHVPPELTDHPRYRIVRVLGSGGMGVVFEAEHRLMERRVALKVISRDLTRQATAVERFRQEVKAAARLDHPNIVRAYDAEQAGELHFLAMEYVEGASLARVVEKRGPLPVAHACHYARQAALGLQHASEHGMVHRDIKPHNLMVTRKGQVKILDFGLARLASERRITLVGTLLGTLDYIAPEQATDSRRADIRCDVYSLGCTLYFLLAGRPPFPEGSAVDKVLAHAEQTPRPLDEVRHDVPRGLAAVVERMMAKEPERRYQTPGEVAQALTPFGRASLQAAAEETTTPRRGKADAATPFAADSDTAPPTARPRRGRRTALPWAKRAGLAAVLLLPVAALSLAVVALLPRGGNPSVGQATNPGATAPTAETAPPAPESAPPRILVVVPYQGFWFPDYDPVRRALDGSKAKVQVASSRDGKAQPNWKHKEAHPVDVDLLLSEARAADYDAVVFVGSDPLPEFCAGRQAEIAGAFLQAMKLRKRKLAAIGQGTKVLYDLDVLREQEATGPSVLRDALPLIKGKYVNKPAVVSGIVITGRDADDAEVFVHTLLRELGWEK